MRNPIFCLLVFLFGQVYAFYRHIDPSNQLESKAILNS